MSFLEIGLLSVVLAGAGKVSVGWLLKKDEAREDRKRGAAQMAQKLASFGLEKTAEFLTDYSVSDYSAMAAKLKDVGKTFLAGEAAVIEEFGQIFERVLIAKLKSETGRAFIAVKLRDAIMPEDVSVIKSAPIARVVDGVDSLTRAEFGEVRK